MAVPRGSRPLILGGTLLFGALLFLLGLLVGISLSTPGPVSGPASGPMPARAGDVPPSPTAASPAPGGASGGSAPVPAPVAPAAHAPGAAAPAPVPTTSGDAGPETAPAIKPLKVKGFGYGAPPSSPPASVLRGPLLEQAGASAGQPAGSATPAPAPTPQLPPAEPLVFSVAVGRFLLEDNAARRSAEARAKGFQPVVITTDPPEPSGWLTVTLGPRNDAVAAGRLAEDAAAQGFDTRLVSWLAP